MHSEIASLQPNQQEADTSITIYIKYSEDPGFTFVVVCTPGRDIFAIFFFHAYYLKIIIYVDIETKNRKDY